MSKLMRYLSLALMATGPLVIGAYALGYTDDLRNVAVGFQALIVGAFCFAICLDD